MVKLKSIERLKKTKVKENKILPNRSSLVFQRGSWQWWDYFCWGITCTDEDCTKPSHIPPSYDQSTVHISCQYHNSLKILDIKRISHCFRYRQSLRYIAEITTLALRIWYVDITGI